MCDVRFRDYRVLEMYNCLYYKYDIFCFYDLSVMLFDIIIGVFISYIYFHRNHAFLSTPHFIFSLALVITRLAFLRTFLLLP